MNKAPEFESAHAYHHGYEEIEAAHAYHSYKEFETTCRRLLSNAAVLVNQIDKMGGGAINENWEFPVNLRTVVLVGRTGNGKSATGNSILLRKEFKSMSSSAGVTTVSELKTSVDEDGQGLNVIDTPGLFDFSSESKSVGEEIVKCMDMSKDGIHAVLLVLSVRSRFSREEEAVVYSLKNFFGQKIMDYMIVVFTGGDDLEDDDESLDDYLGRDCPEPLKVVLEMCGKRSILFDNKTKDKFKKAEQLNKLLLLVDDVVDRNGGKPFTNELFLELKKSAKELHDQTVALATMEGHSREEISELKKQLQRSHDENLKGMVERVEKMLGETMRMLKQELEVEKKARRKAEAAQKKLSDEIRELMVKLERANDEYEEARRKAEQKGGCAIL